MYCDEILDFLWHDWHHELQSWAWIFKKKLKSIKKLMVGVQKQRIAMIYSLEWIYKRSDGLRVNQ